MSALEEYNAHRSWTKQRGQEYVRGDFSDAAINELLAEWSGCVHFKEAKP